VIKCVILTRAPNEKHLNVNNIDSHETLKFGELSSQWWDLNGMLRTLHHINPTRMAFIGKHCLLNGALIADIGCGGGILSETLAAEGGQVTGIDAGSEVIEVAKLHAADQGLHIQYLNTTAEEFAAKHSQKFDVITCMEMLEHVPSPSSVVIAGAQLLKPGGHIFFSTINRTLKAYGLAVVMAEYVLNFLPKGTHHYEKFIQPAELEAWCRHAGLKVCDIQGLHYNPLTGKSRLTKTLDVNYIVYAEKTF